MACIISDIDISILNYLLNEQKKGNIKLMETVLNKQHKILKPRLDKLIQKNWIKKTKGKNHEYLIEINEEKRGNIAFLITFISKFN